MLIGYARVSTDDQNLDLQNDALQADGCDMPAGSDGHRTTARSKGKVERPFRTVKEAHETLYHFHVPETEAEANAWLSNYINRYNEKPHRREDHSRIEDWLDRLPEKGIRSMCSWERFCAFAREPERRKVGSDARLSMQGTQYEIDGDLAGEDVLLWWGLFDHELFAEFNDKRYGPYQPVGGPIPLHRYRARKKSARDKRADRVALLAEKISVPRSALSGRSGNVFCRSYSANNASLLCYSSTRRTTCMATHWLD